MKNTGIVRKIDEFGRVSLPSELRKLLDLEEKSPVEFFTDGSSIVIKKYYLSCVFCNDSENNELYMGKPVCAKCRDKLASN